MPAQRNSPKPSSTSTSPEIETQIVDDENFIEWDFSPGNNTVRLPGLHTSIQSQYHQSSHFISPPVLSSGNFSSIDSNKKDFNISSNNDSYKSNEKYMIVFQ